MIPLSGFQFYYIKLIELMEFVTLKWAAVFFTPAKSCHSLVNNL